ncbi:hypothetical protein AB0J81_19325, partial [Streptomyces bobili]
APAGGRIAPAWADAGRPLGAPSGPRAGSGRPRIDLTAAVRAVASPAANRPGPPPPPPRPKTDSPP